MYRYIYIYKYTSLANRYACIRVRDISIVRVRYIDQVISAYIFVADH